jgi:hypothetical protein
MGPTRLDYDFNPSYPWAGHIAQIVLNTILPVGAQAWIVVHIVDDNLVNHWGFAGNRWLVYRRVHGDYTGGPPVSNLTLGPTCYTNLTALANWVPQVGIGGVGCYDGYPAGGAGPGHLVLSTNLSASGGPPSLTCAYATIDYNSSNSVALVATSTPNLAAYNPYTETVYAYGSYLGNTTNVLILVAFQNHFTIGSIDPQTGGVSPVVDIYPGWSSTNTDKYALLRLDDNHSYLIWNYAAKPWVLDYSAWPVNVAAQTVVPAIITATTNGFANWRTNADGNPKISPAFTGTGMIYVGYTNTPYTTGYYGFTLNGTQLAISAKYASPVLVTAFYPGGVLQRPPASGWPAGWGFTPLLDTDASGNTILRTLGHATTDATPQQADAYTYSYNPFRTAKTKTNKWFNGGLALAASTFADSDFYYGANYDTLGGLPSSGAPPPYAPALWVTDTSPAGTGTPASPLNLWAGG